MRDLLVVAAGSALLAGAMVGSTGCGDDGGGQPADASVDRGAPGPVTLVALADGAPLSGVPVYFQDHREHVVAAVVTDASGRVTAEVATGGVVTAILPSPGAARGGAALVGELYTFVGVEAGDQLIAGTPDVHATGRSIDVVVPAEARSTVYWVETPCAAAQTSLPRPATTPVTIVIDLAGCGDVTDVAVTARAPGVDKVMSALAVPVVGGQPIALAGTWTAPHASQVVVTGVPGASQAVSVQQALWTARGQVGRGSAEVTSNGGRASAEVALAWSPGPALQRWTLVGLTNAGLGAAIVTAWGPHDGADTIDVTGRLLPSISGAASYAAATRTLTWTESGTGAAVDYVMADLFVSRPQDGPWEWHVVGPRDGRRLTLPLLPTDRHDWTPRPSDVVAVGTFALAAHSGGYAAARGGALALGTLRPPTATGWQVVETYSE